MYFIPIANVAKICNIVGFKSFLIIKSLCAFRSEYLAEESNAFFWNFVDTVAEKNPDTYLNGKAFEQ